MTTLNQLVAVFDQLVEAQAPDIDNLPPGTDSIAWFRAHGFVAARASVTGSVVGLPPDGLSAWLEFARAVRTGDPRYARGTRLNPFVEQLFTEVVRLKRGSAGRPLQAAVLTQVETAMAAWFATVAAPQTHVIPCAIIPEAAAPFTVGPVRFSHASAFNAQAFGISPAWRI